MKTIKELEVELDCQYPKADDRTKGKWEALKDVLGLIDEYTRLDWKEPLEELKSRITG